MTDASWAGSCITTEPTSTWSTNAANIDAKDLCGIEHLLAGYAATGADAPYGVRRTPPGLFWSGSGPLGRRRARALGVGDGLAGQPRRALGDDRDRVDLGLGLQAGEQLLDGVGRERIHRAVA